MAKIPKVPLGSEKLKILIYFFFEKRMDGMISGPKRMNGMMGTPSK